MMSSDEKARLTDRHVGLRLRTVRRARGVTQERLADALGITFQQVQKYEKGLNRISASKLYESAAFLGVAVAEFFEGLDAVPSDSGELGIRVETPTVTADPALRRAALGLSRIEDRRARQAVFDLIEALTETASGRSAG